MSSAALTFSQLSVWRSIEPLPPELLAAVALTRVWPLPESTSVEQVTAALTTLTSRHDGLRTRFHPDGDAPPRQSVWPNCTPPLDLEMLADEHEITEVAAAVGAPFEMASEPCWRARLCLVGSRPIALVVCIHHLVADAAALKLLREEFDTLLAGQPLTEPAPSPLELAELQRSARRAVRRAAAIEYWRSVIGIDGGQPMELTEQTRTRWATLESIPALHAARRVAESTNTSVQAVVLTAYCEVIAAREGRGAPLIGLLAGNRTDRRWRGLISTMDQLTPFRYQQVAGRSFPDAVRLTYQLSLDAYRHASFDVDELAEALADCGVDGIGHGLVNFFNFVPTAPAPPPSHPPFDPDQAPGWRIVLSDVGRETGAPRYLHASAEQFLTLRWQQRCLPSEESCLAEDLELMQRLMVDGAQRC